MEVGVGARLYQVPREANRLYRDLLFRADDSVTEVDGYIEAGTLYLWRDGDHVLGHVLVTSLGDGEAELKNLAVDPEKVGRGIGKAMIAAILQEITASGMTRAFVATSAADTGNLHFYQRCGFRPLRIERDVFTPERGYIEDFRVNGILAVDQVIMDCELPRRTR